MNLYVKKNNVSDTLYPECFLKIREKDLASYDLYENEYKVIDYIMLNLFSGRRYNHTRTSRFFIKKDKPIEDCLQDIKTYNKLPKQTDSDVSELFGDDVNESALRADLMYITNSNYFDAFNAVLTSIDLIIVDKVIYSIETIVRSRPIKLNEKMMRQLKRLLPNVRF